MNKAHSAKVPGCRVMHTARSLATTRNGHCADDRPMRAENPQADSGSEREEDPLLADSRLASRCLAGEPDAWEEFYAQCHPPLLVSIEALLGPDQGDPNLVDEIAARVWYALIEHDGRRLARYRPQRGARLITYLRALAKTEVCRHLRRERRRQRRERIALRGRPPHQPAGDAQMAASLGELVPTLTAAERDFYEAHVAGCPSGAARVRVDREPMSANARQLRHRIRKKLLRFLGYQR